MPDHEVIAASLTDRTRSADIAGAYSDKIYRYLLRDHATAERKRLDLMARRTTTAPDTGEERIDDALLAAATLARVAAAIAALSDDARDVVLLVGIEGLGYQEAAVALP